MDTFNGLLVLNKPAGITSRDAVDAALRWFPRKTKVGHTGTLDPFATGVLVLCLGSTTRLAEYVQRMSKTYRSTFVLGASSSTDDVDGDVTPTPDVRDPGRAAVESALAALVGQIEQVPPAFSAAKVSGRRAYDMARRGEEVSLEARTIHVYGIDVLRYEWPEVEVEVRCGKGTYIRSLARDMGASLGCGAYAKTLRRTQVGPFTVDAGLLLDTAAEVARTRLLPPEMALAELPRVAVTAEDARRLRQGQVVKAPDGVGEVAMFDISGLVGIGEICKGELRPAKIVSA